MKVLRKLPGESWDDVLERRAKAVGYDEVNTDLILEDFATACSSELKADAAWEIAQHWDLLETIEAADPGQDLEETA